MGTAATFLTRLADLLAEFDATIGADNAGEVYIEVQGAVFDAEWPVIGAERVRDFIAKA
ncbi:hypothetical protein D3C72_1142440 [compost metagenome]